MLPGDAKQAPKLDTERKLADESQFFLAAILEFSDDAILWKNLDGIIQSWNRGARRLFGYSEVEAVGRPITIIIPEELRDEEKEILRKMGNGEHIEHYETCRVAKDGRTIHASLTISPIRNADGRIIGASEIARDITEQKLAAEALSTISQRLTQSLSELEVLLQLFNLLEQYAPIWYTEEHHNLALAALGSSPKS